MKPLKSVTTFSSVQNTFFHALTAPPGSEPTGRMQGIIYSNWPSPWNITIWVLIPNPSYDQVLHGGINYINA